MPPTRINSCKKYLIDNGMKVYKSRKSRSRKSRSRKSRSRKSNNVIIHYKNFGLSKSSNQKIIDKIKKNIKKDVNKKRNKKSWTGLDLFINVSPYFYNELSDYAKLSERKMDIVDEKISDYCDKISKELDKLDGRIILQMLKN